MSELPELLAEAVDDEVVDRFDLGGDDTVVVTTGATHVYRSEGLLSDESVETYNHDVDRFGVDAGRRRSVLRFADVEGERSFKLPSDAADDVVDSILEGVLRTKGAVDPDETVESIFRFSELTFVVTDRRLLKHIGSAVYDDDIETIRHEDITDLDFEEGTVATQVVVEANGRSQRVKVPNEHSRRVRQSVREAVLSFYDVGSLAELRAMLAEEREAEAEAESETDETTPEPEADAPVEADADPTDGDGAASVPEETGPEAFEFPGERDDVTTDGIAEAEPDPDPDGTTVASMDAEDIAAELEALNAKLDRQTELLESQQATIEQLVEELRRGR